MLTTKSTTEKITKPIEERTLQDEVNVLRASYRALKTKYNNARDWNARHKDFLKFLRTRTTDKDIIDLIDNRLARAFKFQDKNQEKEGE